MMLPGGNCTRINTLELKGLIVKKVGHHRADRYFNQLRRLFSLKISKSEFDKFCIRTLGRENIPLHNQFIRAVLKNACSAKVPPSSGSAKIGSTLSVKFSNGDVFPPSPRRGRSLAARDRKFKDRPSSLGPFGKPQSLTSEELMSKAPEQQSATELHSLGSRPPASVEDGEEVEQMAGSPSIQSRSPVTAPLGISMNFGCARKRLSCVSKCHKHYSQTCHNSEELPDTRSLRSRLEQKLEMEGLTVSVDCVNLLNNGLDTYLKRLIESFMGLAGSRCGNEHLKQLNGRSVPGSNVLIPGRYRETATASVCASLLDFRLAMELNPRVLGPDWPTQLEKICLTSEE